MRKEARTLTAAGYHVSVISPQSPGQRWWETLNDARVYSLLAPPDATGLLVYLREYAYSTVAMFTLSLLVFSREGFDIITHAHNPPNTLAFVAAFYKLLSKRFVHDHHDLAPESYYARFGGTGSRLVYNVLIMLERLPCQLADRIITTNQSHKTVGGTVRTCTEERINIVRNGPDLNVVRPMAPNLGLRRRERTTIGYGGCMGFQDGARTIYLGHSGTPSAIWVGQTASVS